jgi:hypothetical protein
MQNRHLLIFLCLIALGCTPEPEHNSTAKSAPDYSVSDESPGTESTPEKNNDLADTPEPLVVTPDPIRTLDLSAPQYLIYDYPGTIKPHSSSYTRFNAEELFNKEEEQSAISATVTPIIKESDNPDELFELDGGSISVEIKTP